METAVSDESNEGLRNSEDCESKRIISLNPKLVSEEYVYTPIDLHILKDISHEFSHILYKDNPYRTNNRESFDKLNDTQCANALIGTFLKCFNQHLPLSFSASHLWMLITNVISRHVQDNAEKYRDLFCTHAGKKELVVVLPPFGKTDYAMAISQFAQQISDNIKDREFTVNLTTPFSTSTPLDTTVFQCILMNSMQNYFEYVMTRCGIPSIELIGTVADFNEILRRLNYFSDKLPALTWYFNGIKVHINNIVKGLKEETLIGYDSIQAFYNDMINKKSESGLEIMTGWITDFVHYPQGIKKEHRSMFGREPLIGIELHKIANAYAGTEAKLDEQPVIFVSGLFGYTKLDNGYLMPVSGWVLKNRT